MSRTLVHSIDLSVWSGQVVTRIETKATLNYYDGRPGVETTVEPYPVRLKLPPNVGDLWSDEELATVGLEHVQSFTYPEGTRPIGEPRYMRATDTKKVLEIYDVEDIPEPEPTIHDRVNALEVSLTDRLAKVEAALAVKAESIKE